MYMCDIILLFFGNLDLWYRSIILEIILADNLSKDIYNNLRLHFTSVKICLLAVEDWWNRILEHLYCAVVRNSGGQSIWTDVKTSLKYIKSKS